MSWINMKRFMIIGDKLEEVLPNDFTVLWIGEAKNKDDALRQAGEQTTKGCKVYKVIEIAREYAVPYEF